MLETVTIGQATLHCGDCREVLPTLASVPLASGQLQVVTRMPAGVALPAGLEAEALNLEDLFLAMTET